MPEWQVIIYAVTEGVLTGRQQDIIGRDEAWRTVGYVSPPGELRLTGRWEADSAMESAGEAEKLLRSALRSAVAAAEIVDIRAVAWARYEAEKNAEPLDLAGTAEAAEILRVSGTRVGQLAEKAAAFPKPVADLRAGPVWNRRDIEDFGRTWERRPGRPRKDG